MTLIDLSAHLPAHVASPAKGGQNGSLPGARITMHHLLRFAAIIETSAGLALIAVPHAVVRLLLGGEISGASIPLGRVAGFGLLSLGMACWPGRGPAGNATSALRAMLTYNSLATIYLLSLGIGGKWVGPLLWPAVVLHSVMTVSCATFLLKRPIQTEEGKQT